MRSLKLADLVGKTLAAPISDAGRKARPAFQRAAGEAVKWQAGGSGSSARPCWPEETWTASPPATSLLNLEARGVKPADIVALRYSGPWGGACRNAIIASPKLTPRPKAVECTSTRPQGDHRQT